MGGKYRKKTFREKKLRMAKFREINKNKHFIQARLDKDKTIHPCNNYFMLTEQPYKRENLVFDILKSNVFTAHDVIVTSEFVPMTTKVYDIVYSIQKQLKNNI